MKLEGGRRLHRADKSSSPANDPIITIITVVYNGAGTLTETIMSVVRQSLSSVEYIVIDGGSTDDTLKIIRRFENHIDYWVSEPDQGIYDAMNKGIALAKGRWIYFLGADDIILDDQVLAQIIACEDEDNYSLIFGNIIDENGNIFRSELSHRTLLYNTVHHQSAFYKKTLFSNFSYASTIPVISDYELNLKFFLEKKKFKYIDKIVARCSSDGVSHTSNQYQNYLDYFMIRNRYMGLVKNLFCVFVFGLYLFARKLIRVGATARSV